MCCSKVVACLTGEVGRHECYSGEGLGCLGAGVPGCEAEAGGEGGGGADPAAGAGRDEGAHPYVPGEGCQCVPREGCQCPQLP